MTPECTTKKKPKWKPAGLRWRILAHDPSGLQPSVDIESRAMYQHLMSGPWSEYAKAQGLQRQVIRHDTEFDELVIDDWLHIEQMDARVWWMRVGDYHLWVTVRRDGTVTVTNNGKELSAYGLEKDE